MVGFDGVSAAVRRDVERLPESFRHGGLAAAALRLAEAMDERPGPREEAVLARELRACLVELGKLAPSAPERDVLDELASRRSARRSGTAAQ